MAATMAWTVRKTRGFRAYACASRNLDKATGFAKRNHVRKAYGSYEELVHDEKVDLIYIATPHSEHYANAKLCIENGKPCLVEKTFAINEDQARELFALAESKNVFITEAMWTRYMPFVRTMKEVVSSGVIGEPVMLQANLGYALKETPRLNDPSLGGGSLLELGVYGVNFASMLFGDDILRVEASCTYTSRHLDEQDNITLVYRNGRMASLSASMVGETDRRGVISGTKGYVVIDNINNFQTMTVYDADHLKVASYKRPRQKSGYEYELRACREALKNGLTECPEMPHAETLMMMHILDSIRKEMGVTYPAETEQAKKDEAGATRQDVSFDAQGNEIGMKKEEKPETDAATEQKEEWGIVAQAENQKEKKETEDSQKVEETPVVTPEEATENTENADSPDGEDKAEAAKKMTSPSQNELQEDESSLSKNAEQQEEEKESEAAKKEEEKDLKEKKEEASSIDEKEVGKEAGEAEKENNTKEEVKETKEPAEEKSDQQESPSVQVINFEKAACAAAGERQEEANLQEEVDKREEDVASAK